LKIKTERKKTAGESLNRWVVEKSHSTTKLFERWSLMISSPFSWKFIPKYNRVIAAKEGTEWLQNETIKRGGSST
jgi:hypothetical protein